MSPNWIESSLGTLPQLPPVVPPPLPTHESDRKTVPPNQEKSTTPLWTPPATLPPTRGRPRSTSVSSGSPAPLPGSIRPLFAHQHPNRTTSPPFAPSWHSPIPTITSTPSPTVQSSPVTTTADSAAAATARTQNGWIFSPQLVAPGRIGQHRRTASVSPPGVPVITEGEITFHLPKMKPAPITIAASTSKSPFHAIGGRHSPSSPKFNSPTSVSPNSHHLLQLHSNVHANSHAALLSGVRSHALPHSPTHVLDDSDRQQGSPDAPASWIHHPTRVSLATATPASPPFGPTSLNVHHQPSPLAAEFRLTSPEVELAEIVGRSGLEQSAGCLAGDGQGVGVCHADERMPGAFERSLSPPLFPVVLDVPPVTRRRAGSIIKSPLEESESPSSRYLAAEEESTPTFAPCNLRDRPPGSPSSPPLFPTPLSIPSQSSTSNRARARSFTSERNFAPMPLHSPFPIATPSPPISTLPPPIPSLLTVTAALDSPITPIPSDLLLDDHPAPSSPHRVALALPPPLAAPAPLPPHLGGPSLATNRHTGRTAREIAAHTFVLKLGTVPGMEHAPKKHSPLASPSVREDSTDDTYFRSHLREEEDLPSVEEELYAAERTEMDLGVAAPPLLSTDSSSPSFDSTSPYGSPNNQQLDSYLALHSELTLALSPRRAQAPLPLPPPPPPPTSGWDSDEEGDDLSTIDGFLAQVDQDFAAGTTGVDGAHAAGVVGDLDAPLPGEVIDLASFQALRERSLSPPPHLLHVVDRAAEDEPENSSFGFMEVDVASALGLESSGGVPMLPHQEDVGSAEMSREMDTSSVVAEEALSALERIFICAKSEAPEDRARVAHNLAEWLIAVDICEAVEYVLPLLPGLATDVEDMVKEVLSPQLDRIMWHFFSRCSLIELNSPRIDSEATFPDAALHSRFDSKSHSPSRPHSLHSNSDESTSPPTSKTSPANTEIADPPRISATTFTSLLGALLTDQSSVVAKTTQAALVRFLCRLKGKPLVPDGLPTDQFLPLDEPMCCPPDLPNHTHAPYEISLEAGQVLEDEFVTGIVLGLARLDDDDRDPSVTSEPSRIAKPEKEVEASLVLSPEEEDHIEDDWLAAAIGGQGAAPATDATPLRSFFDDAIDLAAKPIDLGFGGLPSNSPPVVNFEPVYSAFSPDPQQDEESAIGKMVSMGLIGAIAMADCLEPEVLVDHILPEVDRMKSEPMFYVRKEAVQALGSLARTLPLEVFETVVLPLHAVFARDSLWHVRRAACLALPAICKRLPPDVLRTQVVANIQYFALDTSRNVRSGALEACGELIYLFHNDPLGVPEEVLEFYLGQVPVQTPTTTIPPENPFSPLASVLDSPGEAYYNGPPSWIPTTSTPESHYVKDPDRPVMCAFNMPAVVLTLGRDKWALVRSFYLELSRDKTDKVRQSLASSFHEIARIIGSEHADDALLEPFNWFLGDYEVIQSAVLEHVASVVLSFGEETGKRALGHLTERWSSIRNWRMREKVAKDLRELGAHFILVEDEGEEILRLLARAFKDPVAAVRDEAVYAIPAMFAATANSPEARLRLFAFLNVFAEDSSYRYRAVYAACATAFVRTTMSREYFEAYFLDTLCRLAGDSVVSVRIGVARAIGVACQILYLTATDRLPLLDVISLLAQSSDRAVNQLALPYYVPSPPTSTQGESMTMDVPQSDSSDVEMEEVNLDSDSILQEFVVV